MFYAKSILILKLKLFDWEIVIFNSQENTCGRVSFFNKLADSGLQLYKKETLAQVFACKFFEISRTNILLNTSGWLLLWFL